MTTLPDRAAALAPLRLSAEQQHANDAILKFAADPTAGRIFSMHGLAGTGKTTVLSHVARALPGARLATLTGKAASVLSRKTRMNVATVHSLFYELTGESTDKSGRRELHWRRADRIGREIILIDESSMIDLIICGDILKTGARIIACGDPGQLPPVRGVQAFDEADLTLTEIHRQALESPIIRQAHAVRAGAPYEADGAGFRVQRAALNDDLLAADMILCWRNATRHALNAQLRYLLGHRLKVAQPGEPVVALRNRPWQGIYNGAIYTLAEPFDPDQDADIVLLIDGEPTVIPYAVWGEPPPPPPDSHNDAAGIRPIGFDFGYTLTVHKSQGSEWNSIVLVDEYSRDDDRTQWLYTGITRAASECLVVGRRV